ncbi:hypothetical protein [uncultured Arcticibacterium sp.]|uniref:hypothetical protein n=1 Tax=uncultured Arcticibacterium sp. TaxID=2173042 RepID=UPI0030F7DD5D
MKAEFYLLNESFDSINPDISSFEDSIGLLSEDTENIKSNGDSILRHNDIYEVNIGNNTPLYKYLFEGDLNSRNSSKKYLMKIIDRAKETNWSNSDIKDLVKDQETADFCNEKKAYGFISYGGKAIKGLEKYTISNIKTWFSFHRYFLGKYPCEPYYFIDECRKNFPYIHIHTRVKMEIDKTDGGWINFTQSFVKGLSCLNDTLPYYLEKSYVRKRDLLTFSASVGIDVTPEGNLKHKPNMTFEFSTVNGLKKVCCEPHMKFNQSDKVGDNTYYKNRIYFYESDPDIENGKILVGHIGQHIDF